MSLDRKGWRSLKNQGPLTRVLDVLSNLDQTALAYIVTKIRGFEPASFSYQLYEVALIALPLNAKA